MASAKEVPLPRIIGAALVLVLAIAGGTAHAQRAPDLATLDRGDGISKIGIDFGLSLTDGAYDAALRLEPYGQYVTRIGLGVYGAIPISRSFGGPGAPPDTAFAVGSFDLGLLYVVEPNPELSWVFRAGVGLPLASDSLEGTVTNFYATFPRLTDVALTVPDAFYGRVSVSPLIHLKRVYFRADLGFDAGSDDDDIANELVRFNAGGGIDLGVIALGAELVNLYTLDDFGGGEQFFHTAAATIRIMGESLQPQFAIGMPLDESTREVIGVFVAAGIQYVPK
jgi:hypothetical protein